MGTHGLIYIRTDANRDIATGHLVRCLSIAQACLALNMDVRFLVSHRESKQLLNGFLSRSPSMTPPIQILETAVYNNLEKELDEVISLLTGQDGKADGNTVYFLDSYFVTPQYIAAIRPYAKMAYMDDLQLFDYPVDLVVNYDVIPQDKLHRYENAYQNAGRALLGSLYTPLRSQFQGRKATFRQTPLHLLITTGGSDPYQFCRCLADAFADMSSRFPAGDAGHLLPDLRIVIGKLYADKAQLYALADRLSFLTLYEDVTDMASLMADCDLAVSAAGTTLYELCALGVPTVSFTMADNQLTSAGAFADAGLVPYAGDIRSSREKVLCRILQFVTDMWENPRNRKETGEHMRQMVDGNGAERIAKALRELLG